MSNNLMKGIMYFGMDTDTNLQTQNPVIPAGMIVLATDDNGNIKMKFGSVTGTVNYNDLPYYVNENTLTATASATTYGVTMLSNSLDVNNSGLAASSTLTFELNNKLQNMGLIYSREDTEYGYRSCQVFGNGFCIQTGGPYSASFVTDASAGTQFQCIIPFILPFKNGNWQGYANVAGGGCEHMSVVTVYSNTELKITKMTNAARNLVWSAMGYVDISTLV